MAVAIPKLVLDGLPDGRVCFVTTPGLPWKQRGVNTTWWSKIRRQNIWQPFGWIHRLQRRILLRSSRPQCNNRSLLYFSLPKISIWNQCKIKLWKLPINYLRHSIALKMCLNGPQIDFWITISKYAWNEDRIHKYISYLFVSTPRYHGNLSETDLIFELRDWLWFVQALMMCLFTTLVTGVLISQQREWSI